jgi:hypothetical protein
MSFARRFFLGALGFVLAANILWILVSVLLAWPEWWLYINYEKSPLTWFSSVQLLMIGVVCLSLVLVEGIRNAARTTCGLWAALGAAFGFLSLDERFQIHERLREIVFKPHQIGTEIPGVGAGDFLPLLYAAAGLAISWFIWREMARNPIARSFLVVALFFAALSVVIDVQPINTLDIMAARREQFFEEIFETLGQMGFLCSFLMQLAARFDGLVHVQNKTS